MSLAVAILVGFLVGLLLLAVIGRRLAVFLWVFCQESLMYFGLLPYPQEVVRRRRVRPSGRAGPADPNPHPDSGP
ncbi:MAG: hypothetical protein ACJ76S_07830 [Solirubrobacteraceae bacterium]|jgi:hypothetical protein